MSKAVLKNIFKGYLVFSIVVGASFMNAFAPSGDPKGIYAKICGSGTSVFIPLGDDESPEPTPPHPAACHAICANKDMEEDDKA